MAVMKYETNKYINDNEFEYDYEDEYRGKYPCDNCHRADSCDGWTAQFCCDLCQYEGRDFCDDCDPMEI